MTTDPSPADPDDIEYLPFPGQHAPKYRLHRADECVVEVESLRTQLAEVTREREREALGLIDERDRAQDFADRLAAAIASLTGADVGEHSSDNNPWFWAVEAAEAFGPRLAEVTRERDEAVARMERLDRAMVTAEQRLGEALGYDVTGRYPGMPLLVGQAKDEHRELPHLRAAIIAAEARLAAALKVVEAAKAFVFDGRDGLTVAVRTYQQQEPISDFHTNGKADLVI